MRARKSSSTKGVPVKSAPSLGQKAYCFYAQFFFFTTSDHTFVLHRATSLVLVNVPSDSHHYNLEKKKLGKVNNYTNERLRRSRHINRNCRSRKRHRLPAGVSAEKLCSQLPLSTVLL